MNRAESPIEQTAQIIHECHAVLAPDNGPSPLFQDAYGVCALGKPADIEKKPGEHAAFDPMEVKPSGINVDFGWHSNGDPMQVKPSGINVDFGWHPNGDPMQVKPSGVNVDFGWHSKDAGTVDNLPSEMDHKSEGSCPDGKPDLRKILGRDTEPANTDTTRPALQNPEKSEDSTTLIVTPYISPVAGFPMKIHWPLFGHSGD
jgi:hypothetical protein